MKRCVIEQLQPDMVLADDILGPDGTLLIPRGAKINERSIATLRRREIQSVMIEGENVDVRTLLSPVVIAEAEGLVRARIRLAGGEPPEVLNIIEEVIQWDLEQRAPPPEDIPPSNQADSKVKAK
jgi:hypothetical protein